MSRIQLKILAVGFISLLTTFAFPVFADESIKIDGEVYLGQEGCPNGIKSKDCNLTFTLSGKAAKMLFDGMRAKAVREECTGGMQKVDGNGLSCIKSDDGKYDCDFGYAFSKKKFGDSSLIC